MIINELNNCYAIFAVNGKIPGYYGKLHRQILKPLVKKFGFDITPE